MKSLLSGSVGLFALIFAIQPHAVANPNYFGSRDQRIPNLSFSVSSFYSNESLPQVDYTQAASQWQAGDFQNFVRDLPDNIKMVQVTMYAATGAYVIAVDLKRDETLAENIAAAINHNEKWRATKLFELKPQGLPGYRVEQKLARYNPKYIPASGQKQVAQYQEGGEYFALLIESFNSDNTITLVNGKVLNKGEYLLAVSEVRGVKKGMRVLHASKSTHVTHQGFMAGTVHRVFQDGSIQLTDRRRILSHVEYVVEHQDGVLKPGVKIKYQAHETHHQFTEAEVANVFKDHLLLGDEETVIKKSSLREIRSCEGHLTTPYTIATTLGK